MIPAPDDIPAYCAESGHQFIVNPSMTANHKSCRMPLTCPTGGLTPDILRWLRWNFPECAPVGKGLKIPRVELVVGKISAWRITEVIDPALLGFKFHIQDPMPRWSWAGASWREDAGGLYEDCVLHHYLPAVRWTVRFRLDHIEPSTLKKLEP